MNQQEKQNTKQDNESSLADLEPIDDVTGGTSHNAGALRNVANTNFTERESGLVYSGESGGMNE